MNIQQMEAKLRSADLMKQGNFIAKNTRGVVMVKGTKYQSGHKGSFAVLELEIVESEGKSAIGSFSAGLAQKKGEDVAVLRTLSGGGAKETMGWNNLKTDVVAIAGGLGSSDPENDGPALVAELFKTDGSPSALARGVLLAFDSTCREPKPGQEPKSYPRFSAIQQTTEEIKARAAELNKRKPL